MLLLLNNDIDVIEPGWLRELVSQALRPDVGTVGAKLLFPNEQVQHAGLVLGPEGNGASKLRNVRDCSSPSKPKGLENSAQGFNRFHPGKVRRDALLSVPDMGSM
jgi:hypothetical protein